jgi:hypothetical protein
MSQLFYGTLAKRDDDKRILEGYATSEAIDASGETIKMTAVKVALDDYLKFPALREMHQLSAIGKVTKAGIDKQGLYISANVVDDEAWRKGQIRGLSRFQRRRKSHRPLSEQREGHHRNQIGRNQPC